MTVRARRRYTIAAVDALTASSPAELLTGVVDSRPALPVAEPLAVRAAGPTLGVRVAAAQFGPNPGDTAGNLARIDKAFFDVNAYVSMSFFVLVLVDELVRRGVFAEVVR